MKVYMARGTVFEQGEICLGYVQTEVQAQKAVVMLKKECKGEIFNPYYEHEDVPNRNKDDLIAFLNEFAYQNTVQIMKEVMGKI